MKKKFILAVLAAALLTQSASMLCVSADEVWVSDEPVIVEVAEVEAEAEDIDIVAVEETATEEIAVEEEEAVEYIEEETAELNADTSKGTDGTITWIQNGTTLTLLGKQKMNEYEEGTEPW